MNPPTPTWKGSSSASGHLAWINPRRSRLLFAWWLAVHGLAALGLTVSALGLPWKCLGLLGLVGHAWRRFPPRVPDLVCDAAGEWTIPCLGRSGLRLAEESRGGGWWIRLVLTDRVESLSWVLFEDQLDPGAWRALQAEVAGPGPD